jgi:hypothetical protein
MPRSEDDGCSIFVFMHEAEMRMLFNAQRIKYILNESCQTQKAERESFKSSERFRTASALSMKL